MNNKLKPALIGGVLLGVLSAIPFVNFVNICCCLWAILGGLLATQMYVKSSPTPVGAGDGAILGAIAGGIGAVVYVILGIPIGIIAGPIMQAALISLMSNVDPRQAEAMSAQMAVTAGSVVSVIINTLIGAVFLLIFSIIGGLLGVPIFEKRKGAPPPPPTQYGSGPGGYAT